MLGSDVFHWKRPWGGWVQYQVCSVGRVRGPSSKVTLACDESTAKTSPKCLRVDELA